MMITLWKALQAGKQIDHPAKWKNVQNTTNALASILSLVVVLLRLSGVDLPITDAEIVAFAGALATILGVINTILTTITTKKISITGEVSE